LTPERALRALASNVASTVVLKRMRFMPRLCHACVVNCHKQICPGRYRATASNTTKQRRRHRTHPICRPAVGARTELLAATAPQQRKGDTINQRFRSTSLSCSQRNTVTTMTRGVSALAMTVLMSGGVGLAGLALATGTARGEAVV
jgi:hypothetical protein